MTLAEERIPKVVHPQTLLEEVQTPLDQITIHKEELTTPTGLTHTPNLKIVAKQMVEAPKLVQATKHKGKQVAQKDVHTITIVLGVIHQAITDQAVTHQAITDQVVVRVAQEVLEEDSRKKT